MKAIKLDCTYEERTSKSDPTKTYKAIFIKLADNYEKMIFISIPEQILIENNHKDQEDMFSY